MMCALISANVIAAATTWVLAIIPEDSGGWLFEPFTAPANRMQMIITRLQ